MTEEKKEIRDKIYDYYKSYYLETLGLKSFEERIEKYRYNEDEVSKSRIQHYLDYINYDIQGKKALVVGTGTGAQVIALNQLGCKDLHGIEPYAPGLELTKLKVSEVGLDPVHFTDDVAEALPYEDESFDFVYCFTVVEHVQNVKKSLDEMVRCLKPGGYAIINTPDYNHPYEPHYKVPAPTFLGNFCTKIFIKLIGRNASFVNTLQLVTRRKIDKILRTHSNITYLRLIKPYPKKKKSKNMILKVLNGINNLSLRVFNIYPNQDIFIKKNLK